MGGSLCSATLTFLRIIFFAASSESTNLREKFPTLQFLFGDVENEEYPPVHRNVEMLRLVWVSVTFDWVMKVDSDTYVNLWRLEALLRALPRSDHAFLGGRGFGRPQDKPYLNLSAPFCMGGPGYLVAKKTLGRVQNHLKSCMYKTEVGSPGWHSDVVIGKCIYEHTSLGCHEGDGIERVPHSVKNFFQLYNGSSSRYDTVTFHPLKDSRAMQEHHRLSALQAYRQAPTPST